MYKYYLFIFTLFLCTFQAVMCECACKRQRSTRNFSSCTPNITITPIGPQRIGLVWSPHWDVKTQSLYMADISAGLINSTVGQPPFYRYDYAENRLYSVTVEGGIVDPSFFLPMAGCKNEFAASNDKRVVVLYWDRVSPSATLVRNMTAVEQNSIYANNHFGTGNVDPKGRLVAGTYREDTCVWTSEANGTLYLFRKDGEIKPLIHNLGTLGGLAWNKKKNLFYFLDSCTYTLFEYKYCPRSGKIRDPRSVYTFPVDHSYIAVSMDISCTGNIFAGKYNGSEVVEIDPRTGTVVNTIRFPADTITAVAFIGPCMDILYVGTSIYAAPWYFDINGPRLTASSNIFAGQQYIVEGLCAKGSPGKRIKSPL